MFTGEKAVKFGNAIVVSATPTLGLARLFPIKPGNIFSAESVEYDLGKSRELMASPIARGGGARRNVGGKFQTVLEKPPYYNESSAIDVNDLKGRAVGVNKYEAANESHAQALLRVITPRYIQLQEKIDRQIEWQAAQILQNGTLPFSTLNPVGPRPIGDIDFLMDADLFPDAVAAWSGATAKQMRDDLKALGLVMRTIGKGAPTDVILGEDANDFFWNADGNLALLDNRRTEVGVRIPEPLGADGFAFEGTMKIGAYSLRFWTYTGYFEDPATGELVAYIDKDAAVMMSDTAARDRFQAGVDIIKPTDAEVMSIFPGGVALDSIADRVAAVSMPWAFTDKKNTTTEIGIATSPLLVPTNRGGHGSVNTNP